MILCSTIRKLAEKGATIYRVDVPEFTMHGKVVIPAHHQYFATRAQADHFVVSMMLPGTKVPRVSTETASMEKHYFRT